MKQRIRPSVMARFHELEKNQILSEDELSVINWNKRKKLIQHAFDHVPYYTSAFKSAGLYPQDIKTEKDWSDIPILTKENIRDNLDKLIATNVSKRNLKPITTGGSTGQPLRLFHDNRFPLEVIGWRMLNWWGVNPYDNAAYCWRIIRNTLITKALNRLLWWPTKRIFFDASMMSEASAKTFLSSFNSLKPSFFQGYTGSIDYLAQFILKNNIIIHSPKCIWGTSSPISATQRKNIESAFGAPLYDQYGCSEVFWLAGQCREKEGLHFFADVRHLELIGDSGEIMPIGKSGNVVVTDLENYACPLIRYKNGDIASFLLDKCACGVNLPLISPVKGRVSDLVKLPNGAALGGDYITTLFDEFPEAVCSFQIRQATDGSIKLLAVPGRDIFLAKESVNKVLYNLRIKIANIVPVEYEFVNEIKSNQGKTRFVISDVQ